MADPVRPHRVRAATDAPQATSSGVAGRRAGVAAATEATAAACSDTPATTRDRRRATRSRRRRSAATQMRQNPTGSRASMTSPTSAPFASRTLRRCRPGSSPCRQVAYVPRRRRTPPGASAARLSGKNPARFRRERLPYRNGKSGSAESARELHRFAATAIAAIAVRQNQRQPLRILGNSREGPMLRTIIRADRGTGADPRAAAAGVAG